MRRYAHLQNNQNTVKNIIITIAAVLVLGAGGWYISSKDLVPTKNQAAAVITAEETVATINGEKILGADFNILQAQAAKERGLDLATLSEQEKSQLKTQVMDILISRKLLQQTVAKSTDINITESQIATHVETIKARFENETAYKEALSAQGITEAQLNTQVAYELALQAYLEQQLNISSVEATEAEIEVLYKQLSAAQPEGPALKDVHDQVKLQATQQKQQNLVTEHVAKLKAEADIEILI